MWALLCVALSSLVLCRSEYFVDQLPGFVGPADELPVMHAGKLEVQASEHGEMFFWSIENKHRTLGSKTIFWLNGGPGCSSMDGLFMEVGPFRVDKDGHVRLNENSWHENANLVFVDQPFGTGFSLFKDKKKSVEYAHDIGAATVDFVEFVARYFYEFPERQRDEIYLAGESYAGQYIPHFAHSLLFSDRGKQLDLRLSGLIIGNGWIDPKWQYLSYLPFAYQRNMVAKNSRVAGLMEKAHEDCVRGLEATDSDNQQMQDVPACEAILEVLLNGLYAQSRLDKSNSKACLNMYDIKLTDSYPSCGMNWPPDIAHVTKYLRREDVLKAIHVDQASQTWHECSTQVLRQFQKHANGSASVTLLPDLLARIPVTLFSGIDDLICNVHGIDQMIKSLEWNGQVGFTIKDQHEFSVNDQVVGSYISERNLTHVRIHGASHMSPFDHGPACSVMLAGVTGHGAWPASSPLKPASSHSHSDSERSRAKPATNASWRAYYRAAGSTALVVVVLLVLVLGIVYCRNVSIRRVWRDCAHGFTRWKPRRSTIYKTIDPSRDIILEEDELELAE